MIITFDDFDLRLQLCRRQQEIFLRKKGKKYKYKTSLISSNRKDLKIGTDDSPLQSDFIKIKFPPKYSARKY